MPIKILKSLKLIKNFNNLFLYKLIIYIYLGIEFSNESYTQLSTISTYIFKCFVPVTSYKRLFNST